MARVSEAAVRHVERLTLQDLKRACIMRSIPFEEVCDKSILGLQSWLLKNYDLPVDHKLLEEYDLWSEQLLRSRGVDNTMLSPTFRLSAIASRDGDGNITKRKRVKSFAPKLKRKKARTTEGLFTGTKKAYTYELAKTDVTKAEVIKMVLEKFPTAKEKSIGIWFNRARKALKNAKNDKNKPG